MIKIENTKVEGWEPAIRGMRNAMNSWSKSDSKFARSTGFYENICGDCVDEWEEEYVVDCILGPNDKDLMKRLASAGKDHAKYRRMITVWVDVTAPLYWWKEHDQYKVGTVTNSCSTMHKIAAKEFVRDDFSCEHLFNWMHLDHEDEPYCTALDYKADGSIAQRKKYSLDILDETIFALNFYRKKFLETNDKRYWWQMIQLLPSSYNQRRTVMLNYEVLANIYHSRRNHRLDEWHTFCDWIENLPESWIITGEEKE